MTVGLTEAMAKALAAFNVFVAANGRPPSVAQMAEALRTSNGNAARLVDCLIERGSLVRIAGNNRTSQLGFGGGILVGIPAETAAQLAAFALKSGDSVSSIVADAIALHIDALEDQPTGDGKPGASEGITF